MIKPHSKDTRQHNGVTTLHHDKCTKHNLTTSIHHNKTTQRNEVITPHHENNISRQDYITRPNEETTQRNEVTATCNEETTQNNDKQPHKKVMAFHRPTIVTILQAACFWQPLLNCWKECWNKRSGRWEGTGRK